MPRRPAPRKPTPWTQEQLTRVATDSYRRQMSVEYAAEWLVQKGDTDGWELITLTHLAAAVILDEWARIVREEAEQRVAFARENGATWIDVAQATGYSTPVTAARRYDPRQREKFADDQRRLRNKKKETD